jgi:hypothetical protein
MAKQYYLIEIEVQSGRLLTCEHIHPQHMSSTLLAVDGIYSQGIYQAYVLAKNIKDAQKLAAQKRNGVRAKLEN